MTPLRVQRTLEQGSGLQALKITFNDNHSTMLSVRWVPNGAHVSLHRMFLEAPQDVVQALAKYLKRKEKALPTTVRFFIEENVKKLDYSESIDHSKLCVQGSMYNLQKIYDELNQEYFDGKLDLLITWFGKPHQRSRSKVTFGLYFDPLKLIKIHRIVDVPSVPDYLVSFVVYHEMLHHVCPSYHDAQGVHQIHSKEFKSRESQFRYFDLAQNWIKEHQGHLFRGMC